VPKETANNFAETFGGSSRDPWQDTVPAPDTQKTAAAPADAGHADAGASQEEVDASKAQPQQEVTADDPAAPFSKLAINLDDKPEGKEGEAGKVTSATEPTPAENEAFMKRINPDGQRPVEEQLQNAIKVAQEAQSAIGRQGAEVGEARKFKADYDRVQAGLKELQGTFQYDKESGKFKATPKGIMQMADAVGQVEIEKALAERGQKIVPLNWKASDPERSDVDADFNKALNEVIPGDELTVDEKAQELTGNPRLQALLTAKLTRYALQREAQRLGERGATEQRTTQQRQQQEKVITDFADSLKKIPYIKELAPALNHWNDQIPFDKPLPVTLRNEILYRLAELNRVPAVIKAACEKAANQREKELLEQFDLTGVPSGEVPTYVKKGAGDQGDKESAVAAKKMRDEMAEANL
jgi:hypothetical protein